MKKIIFAIFLVALCATPVFADTINVPADQPTIQAGINAASDGDLILVESGYYLENINFLGKAVMVRGDSAATTTIDGGIKNSTVKFTMGETAAEIDGFTIRGGTNPYGGGGILCQNSSPTISNCVITENYADFVGGGICVQYSSPTIINCTILKNTVWQNAGGGIYCLNSSPTITNCTITENQAVHGGGFACQLASPVLTNCVISENSADNDWGLGGGVWVGDTSSPAFVDCTISNNVARQGGGACCTNATAMFNNCNLLWNDGFYGGGIQSTFGDNSLFTGCTISGNRGVYGGGVQVLSATPTIVNCSITTNVATDESGYYMSGGGGIQSAGSDTIITGCTISGNTATVFGGGISCDAGGSPTITNCIVTNNWSQYGGGLYLLESSPTITSCTIADNDGDNGKALFVQGFPLVSNCILWGGEPVEAPVIYGITDYLIVNYSNIQMANPDEVWPGGGNINADPLFVGTNDYHLADGSPCIDAGLDVGVYTDFDGDSRPQGSGFDMGADEVVSATPPCFIGMVM